MTAYQYHDVVDTLQQLVRLPSVNPMGRLVEGSPYYEHRVTDFLQAYFERLGVAWHRQTVAPLRDNIVARLDSDAPSRAEERVLVFEVHQDTVPAEGMTIDPWEPLLQNGRLYGRGACDDKGPMACMLTAFARLARERPRNRATVILACTVNEEHGFTGAQALSQAWSRGDDPLVPQLPDAMVVAEPTSLDIVVAHKGVVRWRCHSCGRAVHSSRPDQGKNAIYAMASVIGEVERYSRALAETRPHPRLGVPTVNLGTIHGGVCVNMVPDACTIELDRRLLPDEAPKTAQQALIAWLERRLPPEVLSDLRHDAPSLTAYGLAEEGNAAWAERVQRVLDAVGITPRRIGVPYATDAPFFAQLGIPTIILGPGSIEQAHTADEWISVAELHLATEAYYRLALEL